MSLLQTSARTFENDNELSELYVVVGNKDEETEFDYIGGFDKDHGYYFASQSGLENLIGEDTVETILQHLPSDEDALYFVDLDTFYFISGPYRYIDTLSAVLSTDEESPGENEGMIPSIHSISNGLFGTLLGDKVRAVPFGANYRNPVQKGFTMNFKIPQSDYESASSDNVVTNDVSVVDITFRNKTADWEKTIIEIDGCSFTQRQLEAILGKVDSFNSTLEHYFDREEDSKISE